MDNRTPSYPALHLTIDRSFASYELGSGEAWPIIEPLIYATLEALTQELGQPSPVHRKDPQSLDAKIRGARNEAISLALSGNNSLELARLRAIVTSAMQPEEMAVTVRKVCSMHRALGDRIVRVSGDLFNAVYTTYYGASG